MNLPLSFGFMLRSWPTRLVALVLTVLLAGSACSSAEPEATDTEAGDRPGTAAAGTGPVADDGEGPSETAGEAADGSGGSLADLVSALPSAPVGFPTEDIGPLPTSLTIESLGIADAPVTGVGVEPSGAMEVPPASEVGWYRYSPTPGHPGSSILAAHIAYDGEDGVFVSLADVEPGAVVEVSDDEGLTRSYRVETVDRYDKEALPEEIVFARSGTERLVLVTCGGRFDPVARSYDDNVVVVATPLAPAG